MVNRVNSKKLDSVEGSDRDATRLRKKKGLDDSAQLAALVFVERYGLDGRSPRSLAEVAEEHGLTRLDVRLLETRVLAILKAAFAPTSPSDQLACSGPSIVGRPSATVGERAPDDAM